MACETHRPRAIGAALDYDPKLQQMPHVFRGTATTTTGFIFLVRTVEDETICEDVSKGNGTQCVRLDPDG
jgi:hypothetical protein